jgi:hypothetical protein
MTKEPIEIDPRQWRKQIKAGIGNSPIRILVELITNSIDSYKRLKDKGLVKPPVKVLVKYIPTRESAWIEVKDEAEGMNYRKLMKSLKYGAAVSGLEKGSLVRGAMGIGLKDSCIAMKDSRIISIKDDKISEVKVWMDKIPYKEPIRKEEVINDEERKKLGIKNNGTIVKGILDKNYLFKNFRIEGFKIPPAQEVEKLLTKHFMLRKILQIPEYEIFFLGPDYDSPRKLTYSPPEGKILKEEQFEISDAIFGKFKVRLLVKKAKEDLSQIGEFRDGGLVHYYGEYAVVDCTLWGFENDPFAKKMFGEVYIEGFDKLLRKEEDVLDEKRRGLNQRHPFIEKLSLEIATRLKILVEKERETGKIAEYNFDESSKINALKELNKIAKQEIAGGKEPIEKPLPIKPETISFYPIASTEIKVYEEKTIYLVINEKIAKKEMIKINCTTENIRVTPNEFLVDKKSMYSYTKNGDKYLVKTIKLYSENVNCEGMLTATFGNFTDSINIKVIDNPKLYPPNGFAFFPPETKIVVGNEKNIDLVIEKDLIGSQNKIKLEFEVDNPNIFCKKCIEFSIDTKRDILGNKVIVLPIPVKGLKMNEKGSITTTYKDKKAEVKVKVVSPFGEGLFKEIKIVEEEVGHEISYFNKMEAIIYVYAKHPLVLRYKEKKDFQKQPDFLTFIADTITRTVCWEIVKNRKEKGSLEILNPKTENEEMEHDYKRIYFEHGGRMHDILIPFLKTLKI